VAVSELDKCRASTRKRHRSGEEPWTMSVSARRSGRKRVTEGRRVVVEEQTHADAATGARARIGS
jgi:hypothetical protein